MSAPTSCSLCMREFIADSLLQAEARFVAATEGESRARFVVDAALEGFHESHGGGADAAERLPETSLNVEGDT